MANARDYSLFPTDSQNSYAIGATFSIAVRGKNAGTLSEDAYQRAWRVLQRELILRSLLSDVGPYPATVRHGETGWLVENTTSARVDALERLIADADLRRHLAEGVR